VRRPPFALPLLAALCGACGGGVPILMYHSVGPGGETLTVLPAELDGHLDFLARAGFTTVTLHEMLEAQQGRGELPKHPVVLTFDDGYQDAFTEVLPRLQARGQRATFFIVSGFTAENEATRLAAGRHSYLAWPEVRALGAAGMEIGSHTIHHGKLTTLGRHELRAEVVESKAALEHGLGQPVEFFAYPFNEQCRPVRLMVEKAGYRGAVVGAHGNAEAFTLQRLTMHRGISPDDLRSMLAETWQTAYTEGG